MLPLTHWTPRRLLTCWGAGLLLEAALLLPLFVFLVPPEPPLVERLQGRTPYRPQTIVLRVDSARADAATRPPPVVPPPAEEDSFYTVLHWPRHKPLLAGGGRVVAMPRRLWWVPALYVGAVPLAMVALTSAWVVARARRRAATDAEAV